ncbi:MAG: PD-(D/E)XK nuclease domain-containing protein [Treponema sp.]|nr:PD-(D/E)XK nuclease domain-containing protein [Treponema sp.]
MTRIKAFTANMPYGRRGKEEQVIQNAFYMIFTLMGQLSRAEVHSFKGRADCVGESRDRVYLFEFKLVEDEGRNGTGRALGQIEEKGYGEPYLEAGKKIVRIGVEYNLAKRLMGDWAVSGD